MGAYRSVFYSRYQELTGKTEIDLNDFRSSARQHSGRWANLLPKDKNSRFLDLACGNGEFLYFLQQRGFRNSQGVDVCPGAIKTALRMGVKGVQCGDLFAAFQRDDTYDVVTAFNLFEHLTKDEVLELLNRIYSALRPGGALWIVTPNGLSPFGSATRYWDFSHELSFTPASWRELTRLTGFRDVRFRDWGPIPHSIAGSLRWVAWQGLRCLIDLWSYVEVGGPRDSCRVYTADMKVILLK